MKNLSYLFLKCKNYILVLIVIFSFHFSNLSFASTIDTILAIVNDEIITKSDADSFKEKLKKGGLVDDALLKFKEKDFIVKNDKKLIDHLIEEKLIDSEVKRLGLSMTIERVEQEIRSITSRNGISRADLIGALSQKGVVFSDYQDFIKTSLERQSLIEKEVSSKIKISDDEISSYYIQNMGNEKTNLFEYEISHILFSNKNEDTVAKSNAERVLNKLEAKSESFETLAEQFSEDSNFTAGGILGTFKSGEMLPEFEKAIKHLEVGQTSNIVKTKLGYHILKLSKKSLVPNPAYEAEKEKIRAKLFSNAFQKQFLAWIENKRKNSFVKVN